MKKRILEKLKSNSGESIAETLVAVLISAFALLMLAGSVNTASNLITNSQNKLEEYYADYNDLADPASGSDVSVTVTESGVEEVIKTTGKKVPSKIGGTDLIVYG